MLAEKLSITQGTYNRYENDNIEPNIQLLHKLCTDFDVNINWLLTGEGNMFLQDQVSDEDIKQKNDPVKHKELDYYIKRVIDLEKQTKELKKNIQNIEDSYNQVTDNYSQERLKNTDLYNKNQMLNDELTSRLKELIECKDLIIKLSTK